MVVDGGGQTVIGADGGQRAGSSPTVSDADGGHRASGGQTVIGADGGQRAGSSPTLTDADGDQKAGDGQAVTDADGGQRAGDGHTVIGADGDSRLTRASGTGNCKIQSLKSNRYHRKLRSRQTNTSVDDDKLISKSIAGYKYVLDGGQRAGGSQTVTDADGGQRASDGPRVTNAYCSQLVQHLSIWDSPSCITQLHRKPWCL